MFKNNRFLLFSILSVAALALVSCKEKDEDETSAFFSKKPVFEFPSFSTRKAVVTMTASGVTDSEGNEAEYYWYPSYAITERDTCKTYTITMPDDYVTFEVTCTAFKEGYYTSSTTKSVTVVSADRESGSLTGREFDKSIDSVFKDERDGREYWYTRVGDTDWFRDNLAYGGSGITISEECSELDGIFGRYYSWEEAQTACPEGWRLASLEDWNKAAETAGAVNASSTENIYDVAGHFMADIKFNYEAMWEYWPAVRITNSLRLDATPCGYVTIDPDGKDNAFRGVLEYAAFWTSDEKDDEMGYYRYIFDENPHLMLGTASKEMFGASVRCVRDAK